MDREQCLECARLREAERRLPACGVTGSHEEQLKWSRCNFSNPISANVVREEDEAEDVGANAEEDADLASGRCRAPDALIAEENANAEFLIGLDGSLDDDAVGKLAAIRAKLNMAAELQKSVVRRAANTSKPHFR